MLALGLFETGVNLPRGNLTVYNNYVVSYFLFEISLLSVVAFFIKHKIT